MIIKYSFLCVLYIFKLASCSSMDLYKNARLGSRLVQTRYGSLQGIILPLENYKFLRPVEAFLGVPYATPPTKSNRLVNFLVLFYWAPSLMPTADNPPI